MNQTSQYIFQLYHYLLNLRDTIEYTIDREHSVAIYNQRKTVLTEGKKSGTALGNFLDNNQENAAKVVAKLDEFISDFYSDESTVLKVVGETVRVDHTQNIKIFEESIQLAESVRDIIYGYVQFAKSKGELDPLVEDLIRKDEKLYRVIVEMLIQSEFQKSFAEFQKVMGENKGQPSPQSNFIVQNELNKLASLLRFSRQHCHATDNETLDLLDRGIQVIEMSEGRRDRRDNKSFKELFDMVNLESNTAVRVREPIWKEAYEKVVSEAVAAQKAAADAPKA